MSPSSTKVGQAPTASPGTLGAAAWLTVAEQLRLIRGYRQAVLTGRDPEDLHQLRVALRRLRAALDLAHEALDLPPAAHLDSLKALTRALGRLRDLDIGLELTEPLVPFAKGEEAVGLERIRSTLSRRRRAATKAVRRALRSSAVVGAFGGLRRWVRQPTFHPPAFRTLDRAAEATLAEAWAAIRAHPLWQRRPRRQPTAEEAAKLHALRKEARRLRYLLETLARGPGEGTEPSLELLHRVQDALGALQDLATVERIVEQIEPEPGPAANAIRRSMARRRTEALAAWESLRTGGSLEGRTSPPR